MYRLFNPSKKFLWDRNTRDDVTATDLNLIFRNNEYSRKGGVLVFCLNKFVLYYQINEKYASNCFVRLIYYSFEHYIHVIKLKRKNLQFQCLFSPFFNNASVSLATPNIAYKGNDWRGMRFSTAVLFLEKAWLSYFPWQHSHCWESFYTSECNSPHFFRQLKYSPITSRQSN